MSSGTGRRTGAGNVLAGRFALNSWCFLSEEGEVKPPDPSSAVAVERRRGYRTRIQARARVRVVGAPVAQETDAIVYDVSVHGVGFSALVSFEPGAQLHFDMPQMHNLGRRMTVCHCRPRGDGLFDIGCRFI